MIDQLSTISSINYTNFVETTTNSREKEVAIPKSEAEEFYDSVVKPDLGVDLSPYIEIDHDQMETNKVVSQILNKHSSSLVTFALFDFKGNMLADTFGLTKEMQEEGDAHARYLVKLQELLKAIMQKDGKTKQDLLRDPEYRQKLLEEINKFTIKTESRNNEGLHLGSPDYDDPSIRVYSNQKWYTLKEWHEVEKDIQKNNFLNIYQINKDSLYNVTFDSLFRLYENEMQKAKDLFWTGGVDRVDSLYGGSGEEFIKGSVAEAGRSKQEWLELAQSNYDVLKEHIEKKDFNSMSTFRKEGLTRMFHLADSILTDMKEAWKYGDMDTVA